MKPNLLYYSKSCISKVFYGLYSFSPHFMIFNVRRIKNSNSIFVFIIQSIILIHLSNRIIIFLTEFETFFYSFFEVSFNLQSLFLPTIFVIRNGRKKQHVHQKRACNVKEIISIVRLYLVTSV